MYCRTNHLFDIYGSGYATFKSLYRPDCQNLLGAYDEIEVPFLNCCDSRTEDPNQSCDHQENKAKHSVIVYPNPIGLGESLQIKSNMPLTTISLSDISGQGVINLLAREENGTIFVTIPSSIPTGCYNLEISSEDNLFSTILFIH